jgi:hypothetical protein
MANPTLEDFAAIQVKASEHARRAFTETLGAYLEALREHIGPEALLDLAGIVVAGLKNAYAMGYSVALDDVQRQRRGRR